MGTKSDCRTPIEIDNSYIQDIDKYSGAERMSNIFIGKWLCFTGHILLNIKNVENGWLITVLNF